jgi:3-phytase
VKTNSGRLPLCSSTTRRAVDDELQFRIDRNKVLGIDGVSHTDGIAISSPPLPGYPNGVLVVQDGYNAALFRDQNFKVIDWLEIESLLKRAGQ